MDENGECICPIDKNYYVNENGDCVICAPEKGFVLTADGTCICDPVKGYVLTDSGECDCPLPLIRGETGICIRKLMKLAFFLKT